jgi:multidrug efflux system membrane fusion protein
MQSPVAAAAFMIIAASIVGTGCSKKDEAPRSGPTPVRVGTVEMLNAPLTITSNGVVEPMQTVAVEAQVSGTLLDVAFGEGQDVQAGQVLFRIDPRPFQAALSQAQAALARDLAQAGNAMRDAARYSDLAKKDYVTKSQADQQNAMAVAAGATVTSDSAAVEAARVNLSYATIRAPISGRTGSLLIRKGNLVGPGAGPLVVINQLRPILVRFTITQRDFPALQRRAAAGPVPVRLVAGDSVPVAEVGELAFIDNKVDSLTGTVTAKARFQNAPNLLWPGEYVTAIVELQMVNATAVPSVAVQSGQSGSYVYVVGGDKAAQVRPITIGPVIGDRTVILTGLKAGETVVVDGQSRLTPGANVTISVPGNGTAPGGRSTPSDGESKQP